MTADEITVKRANWRSAAKEFDSWTDSELRELITLLAAEVDSQSSKLGECKKALTEIYALSGDVTSHDDMTLPEINSIALGAIQEPPK